MPRLRTDDNVLDPIWVEATDKAAYPRLSVGLSGLIGLENAGPQVLEKRLAFFRLGRRQLCEQGIARLFCSY